MTDRKFGFELLTQQCGDAAAEAAFAIVASHADDPRYGATPIERLLFLSLLLQTTVKFLGGSYWDICSPADEQSRRRVKESDGFDSLIIAQRQADVPHVGRVDFLFQAYGYSTGDRQGVPGWRNLIVECDGHDFHERTREQAAKDRSRDRAATMAGIEVFRFTGSELWRDPWGCGKQIIAWADKGI